MSRLLEKLRGGVWLDIARQVLFSIAILGICIAAVIYFTKPGQLSTLSGGDIRSVRIAAWAIMTVITITVILNLVKGAKKAYGRRPWTLKTFPDGYSLYIVKPGQKTAQDVAADLLGDAAQWISIAMLNVGIRQSDGRMWRTMNQQLRPGWHILVPISGQAAPKRQVPITPLEIVEDHDEALSEGSVEDDGFSLDDFLNNSSLD